MFYNRTIVNRFCSPGAPDQVALFAIELLAAMIRSHSHIKGIRIWREDHLISLYANDVLFYLHDPFNSITLYTIYVISIWKYGKLLGYKVNWYKAEIKTISNFDDTLLRTILIGNGD